MLPQILTHAKCAVSFLKPEARSEAVQEVAANACQAYARLVDLGKTDIAYPIALARYGVKQTRDHRKVGGHLNIKDVLRRYCQTRKGVIVEKLDKFDRAENAWEEVLVEDKTAGPSEIASTRIDFSDWLASLTRRDRRIAESLAEGNRTADLARKFKISAGRISQLRRELAESWRKFVGDDPSGAALAA
jgi:DNA-binding NarL/FixJ family response regulator